MKLFQRTFCILLFFLATPACAQHGVKVAGIYSTLGFHDESGDVLGDEIFIMYTEQGYYALVQHSEGAPAVPVLAPARIEGDTIIIDLPADRGGPFKGHFKGNSKAGELVGTFESNARKIRLPRKASYWQ